MLTLVGATPAPGQLPEVKAPETTVPELPALPNVPAAELPETPSVLAVDELVNTVGDPGVELPDLSGSPPAQSPPSSPSATAPQSPSASTSQSAATADGGPAAAQTSSSDPGRASESAEGPSSSADRRGGVSPRSRAAATPAGDPEAEEGSSLGRVFSALEALPWTLLAAIVGLALLAFLMTGRSAGLVRLSNRLKNQGRELREDVGALQAALLPTVPKRIGSVEFSVAYRPAGGPAAGGDFHDVLKLDDRRIGIIIGDVSGHGREALTITALVHYTVRAYLEAGLEPRHALRLADDALGGKLGGDFATVLAAIYDTAESTLDYATAGHPAPIILGEHTDHAVSALSSPPIGVGPRTGARQTRVAIGADSRICFFSDGLIEVHEPGRSLLGRDGLITVLDQLGDRVEANELLDRVTEGSPVRDDMTVCLLHPLQAGRDWTVIEELELDAERDLAGFLTACGLAPADARRADEESRRRADGTTPARLRVERTRAGVRWQISDAEHADARARMPIERPTEPAPLAIAR